MLKRLAPNTRIALGMTATVAGILFLAELLGLLPSAEQATLVGRARLCETLALSSSVQLLRNDVNGLKATLQGVCDRNPDVLSIGVRARDGRLLAEFGEHQRNWAPRADGRSTEAQMQVPIFQRANERWGTVEFRFTPLRGEGWMQYLKSPMVLLLGFVTQACLICFSFVLRLALRHLDPSKVVPKRVRDALDNLAEGLLILDTKDQILLANSAFAQVVGVDPDRLVGHRVGKLGWEIKDSLGGQAFPWTEAIRTQRPISNSRLHIRGQDGVARTFSVNCSPLLGHQGRYCGVMATFDDVTALEQKNVELGIAKKQAEEAQQAAEAANRAKSEFLANMSHEIRTPLNAVMGFTDVLRRGMEESPQKRVEYLNTIHASGTHLLEVINDILDLSKIESGKLELESTACSPFAILHDVVNVMRVRAEQKGIKLSFELAGKIPAEIEADPTRLRQILMNLTGNAIKFTSEGGVRIVARLMPKGHRFLLEYDVIDTGIGMTEQQLQKIFKPFEQADNTVTRRFGGTGLGLSISKRFANAMGGDITVRSEQGKGSTFTLTTPVQFAAEVQLIDAADGAAMLEKQSTSQDSVLHARIRPSRILLVDDGDSNRELASLVLRRLGLQVTEAVNGQEAVDAALGDSFDLILMDMQMPVMDGYTAAGKLREAGFAAPIVALTANAMRGDEEKCRVAGCSHFLTKPININALIALLAEVLGTVSDSELAGLETNGPDSTSLSIASAGNPPVPDGRSETAPRNAAKPGRGPLVTSLPMDDPEFRRIVDKFTHNLVNRLQEMFQAFSRGDFAALADHAHWLKGAGGTVGFTDFTEPAKRLEALAKSQATDEVGPVLTELIDLARAIDTTVRPTEVPQQV